MSRGTGSFISRANKKRDGQSDTEQLISIKQHLKKKHKIKAMREPYLIFDLEDNLIKISNEIYSKEASHTYNIKNPDLLWIDKYGLWVIEVDGKVHLRKSEKTEKRNKLFIKNRINLIVVPLYEFNLKEFNIYDYIDERILEIIKQK